MDKRMRMISGGKGVEVSLPLHLLNRRTFAYYRAFRFIASDDNIHNLRVQVPVCKFVPRGASQYSLTNRGRLYKAPITPISYRLITSRANKYGGSGNCL